MTTKVIARRRFIRIRFYGVFNAGVVGLDLYIDVVKKCQEIEGLLKTSSLKSSVPIEDSLKKLCNLELECLALSPEMTQMESITHCLQPLFAVQVLLNPSTETAVFVNQLLMVQRLKSYSNARLYCEIIRACLMCLHNVTGTFKESQWGAFTFLKVPLILKELHVAHANGWLVMYCMSPATVRTAYIKFL